MSRGGLAPRVGSKHRRQSRARGHASLGTGGATSHGAAAQGPTSTWTTPSACPKLASGSSGR